MSILASSLDSLISKMDGLFPGAERLPNPYDPSLNPEPYLAFGYGIMIGSSSESRAMQSSVGIKRKISIIQTRSFIAVNSDPSTKEDAEKLLIEDQISLLKNLENDFNLGGLVNEVAYVSDGGIQSVFSNQKQFLKIETQFSMQYVESLN